MAGLSLQQVLQLDGTSCTDGSLLLSLHPDGSHMAVARGPLLCICPLIPASAPAHTPTGEGEYAAGHPGEQQALRERHRSHASAGPRGDAVGGGARGGNPHPRFVCTVASGPPSVSADDITALAWLAFARPPGATGSSGGGAGTNTDRPGAAGMQKRSSGRRRTNSSGSGGGGVFTSIQAMLEDAELAAAQRQRQQQGPAAPPPPPARYSLVVLVAGTRGGSLQLHDADSGAVLLRQQMHAGPVLSVAVRTWRMGLKPDDAVEDVTIGWADAVARLAAWELRAAATSCYAAAAARARGDGGGGQPRFGGLWGPPTAAGPEVKPIVAQKWEVPAAARSRSCVVCCGQRPRDLYALLQKGVSTSTTATGKTIFLAGGGRPACLMALEVDEQSPGGGGALSYITSVATSVSSGVMGLARTARNVAAAPLAFRDGLRYFMNPLQLGLGGGSSSSTQHEPQQQQNPHQQPLASFADASAGQRAPATSVWRQHRDEGRAVVALAPAPHGSLVAAVDNLGRVLLVEVGAMLVSRMWKGYRDAQVGWMEVPAGAVARLLQRRRAEEQGRGHQGDKGDRPLPGPGRGEQGQPDPGPPGDAVGADGAGHRSGASVGTGVASEGEPHQVQSRRSLPGPGPRAPTHGLLADAGTTALHHSGTDPSPGPQKLPQPQLSRGASGPQAPSAEEDEEEEDSRQPGGDGRHVLLLALYAPRRQSLELWWPLHGDRLVAVSAPPRARLLQRGGGGCGGGAELGTWRVAEAASAAEPPMAPAGCMLCVWEQGREREPSGEWECEAWEQWPDAAAAAGGGGEDEEKAGSLVLRDLREVFGLL